MAHKSWRGSGAQQIFAGLDIGSSKTVCLIATPMAGLGARRSECENESGLRVVGVAQKRSDGVTAGVITDLDCAEQVARATIAEAEAMAGVTLDRIGVVCAGAQVISKNFRANAAVTDKVVTEHDLIRLKTAGRDYASQAGRTIIHQAHRDYRIDGGDPLVDPIGMAGQKVSADYHSVSVDNAPLQNLSIMVERCYLSPKPIIPAALASGLAATTEEERQLGVVCIDFGGGTTTLSVFHDTAFLYQETFPVGANHITFDIARALNTPLAEAERIKALYGSVIRAQSDAFETFSYPLVGQEDGETGEATRAVLSKIIAHRFEALASRIKTRLAASGAGAFIGDQVVIPGGGSQMIGATTYLSQVFGKRVRLASPSISGLPSVMATPAFTCAVGLLKAQAKMSAATPRSDRNTARSGTVVHRFGAWLKSGF